MSLLLLIGAAAAEEEGGARAVSSPTLAVLSEATLEESDGGEVDAAQAPSFYASHASPSPAGALLGSDAPEIQRPGTPGDLVLSLEDAFDARAISVEASPYWLTAPAGLSLAEHLQAGWPTLLRNASLSVAVQEGDADDDGVTPMDVALGGRLTWWPTPAADSAQGIFLAAIDQGTAPPDEGAYEASACLALLTGLDALADQFGQEREALLAKSADQQAWREVALEIRELERQRQALKDGDAPDKREQLAALREQIASKEKKRDALDADIAEAEEALWEEVYATWEEDDSRDDRATCAALLQAREGLSVDIAGAARMTSTDSSVSGTALTGFTAWLAPGWIFSNQKTSAVLMGRLYGDDWADTQSLTLDSGARLIHALERVAFSAEAGYRHPLQSADPATWVIGGLDIEVQDGMWVAGNLGVSTPFDEPSSLISSVSFTVDFSEERTVLPSTAPPMPE